MSFTVDIDVADPGWDTLVPGLFALAEKAVAATADGLGPKQGDGEISLVFADDAFVRTLNADHRGKDAPTNVLSFPNGFEVPAGAPRLLGDVVLARETVAREAAEQDKPVADHVAHLLVHGVLHLCGWDHETEDEARAMEALEVDLLARLGVPDPYRSSPPEETAPDHEAASA
jgi:probable rRNA maturation factor